MHELNAIIHGRVQMVMYRDFTQRSGKKLGLTGTVQNLSDGTVKVIAQGEKVKLEELLLRLKKGSLLSRVDRVEETWGTPLDTFTKFTISYQ